MSDFEREKIYMIWLFILTGCAFLYFIPYVTACLILLLIIVYLPPYLYIKLKEFLNSKNIM